MTIQDPVRAGLDEDGENGQWSYVFAVSNISRLMLSFSFFMQYDSLHILLTHVSGGYVTPDKRTDQPHLNNCYMPDPFFLPDP